MAFRKWKTSIIKIVIHKTILRQRIKVCKVLRTFSFTQKVAIPYYDIKEFETECVDNMV